MKFSIFIFWLFALSCKEQVNFNNKGSNNRVFSKNETVELIISKFNEDPNVHIQEPFIRLVVLPSNTILGDSLSLYYLLELREFKNRTTIQLKQKNGVSIFDDSEIIDSIKTCNEGTMDSLEKIIINLFDFGDICEYCYYFNDATAIYIQYVNPGHANIEMMRAVPGDYNIDRLSETNQIDLINVLILLCETNNIIRDNFSYFKINDNYCN